MGNVLLKPFDTFKPLSAANRVAVAKKSDIVGLAPPA
jgi:hypothetical protein